MEDLREIEICEPAPFLYYENGQIAVTDGSTVWMVIVTCEAMMVTALPPEKSLRRLVRYANFYRDLAAGAILRGEDVDGKMFITEADVLAAIRPSGEASTTSGVGGRSHQVRGAA
jgi:hypothetical protein